MRIPCIKCKHLHDSTVTPFMYDNIKPGQPNPNPSIFYNVSSGSFKCVSCGTKNKVQIVWGLEKYDNISDEQEKEWAEANKYKKAITNAGKVHYVTVGGWQKGKVNPFCNYRSWIGNYWGQGWKLTDKPVTCKNCLSKMWKEMRDDRPEDTDRVF